MNLDWKQLREDKLWLLKLISEMENNRDAWTQSDIDHADGIIMMIDAVQDYAVDSDEIPESEVFGDWTDEADFHKEEHKLSDITEWQVYRASRGGRF